MKRIFDLVITLVACIIFFLPLLIISTLVKITSPGPILYWSDRVGKENKNFLMPKFRTMRIDTPEVATHLLKDPGQYITKIGDFLRKTSLDELPQLYNVIKGDMSLVGPRPALYNQEDLIALRTRKEVHTLRPGITGWAQVNGRDELEIPIKVKFDKEYLNQQGMVFDIKIIFLTIYKIFKKEGVSH